MNPGGAEESLRILVKRALDHCSGVHVFLHSGCK